MYYVSIHIRTLKNKRKKLKSPSYITANIPVNMKVKRCTRFFVICLSIKKVPIERLASKVNIRMNILMT